MKVTDAYADTRPPHLEKDRFLENIRRLMESATPKLKAAQARYKADFDKKVRPLKPPKVDDMVYVSRESGTAEEANGIKRRQNCSRKRTGRLR